MNNRHSRRLVLEKRIVFDAAAVSTVADTTVTADPAQVDALLQQLASPTHAQDGGDAGDAEVSGLLATLTAPTALHPQSPTAILFVDSAVKNHQQIVQAAPANAVVVVLDASRLFRPSVTRIGFRRGTFLRGYMYEFIELFAPHLARRVVDEAWQRHTRAELDEMFAGFELPTY